MNFTDCIMCRKELELALYYRNESMLLAWVRKWAVKLLGELSAYTQDAYGENL